MFVLQWMWSKETTCATQDGRLPGREREEWRDLDDWRQRRWWQHRRQQGGAHEPPRPSPRRRWKRWSSKSSKIWSSSVLHSCVISLHSSRFLTSRAVWIRWTASERPVWASSTPHLSYPVSFCPLSWSRTSVVNGASPFPLCLMLSTLRPTSTRSGTTLIPAAILLGLGAAPLVVGQVYLPHRDWNRVRPAHRWNIRSGRQPILRRFLHDFSNRWMMITFTVRPLSKC